MQTEGVHFFWVKMSLCLLADVYCQQEDKRILRATYDVTTLRINNKLRSYRDSKGSYSYFLYIVK